MRRALDIDEQSYGAEHPEVAIRLNNLAMLLQATNRLAEAEPMMRRALTIDEQSYGAEHPKFANVLSNLAKLLWALDRSDEGEILARRAVEVFKCSLGSRHPSIAAPLSVLTRLLRANGELSDAVSAISDAVRVVYDFRRQSGHEHPLTSIIVQNFRDTLSETGILEDEIERRLVEVSKFDKP